MMNCPHNATTYETRKIACYFGSEDRFCRITDRRHSGKGGLISSGTKGICAKYRGGRVTFCRGFDGNDGRPDRLKDEVDRLSSGRGTSIDEMKRARRELTGVGQISKIFPG